MKIRAFSEIQIWVHKHLIHMALLFFLTGLVIMEPWMFEWMAAPLSVVFPSKSELSSLIVAARMIHRVTAVVFAPILVIYALYELFHLRELRIWPEGGFSEGIRKLIDYYVHKRRVDFGKYNLGQKIWVWSAALGIIMMYVTGVILWFNGCFSASVRQVAHLLHEVGFFLGAAGLLVHVYLATVIPEHRPVLSAMFRTGLLSEKYVKSHAPRWYSSLKEREKLDEG